MILFNILDFDYKKHLIQTYDILNFNMNIYLNIY